jgi:vacuolar-type H+-ATPase subunit E/Vma4
VFPEFEIEVCDAEEIEKVNEEEAMKLVQQEAEHRQEAEKTLAKFKEAQVVTQGGGGAVDENLKETVEEMTEMASMRQKDIVLREGVDSGAMRDQTTFKFMVAVAAAKNQVCVDKAHIFYNTQLFRRWNEFFLC